MPRTIHLVGGSLPSNGDSRRLNHLINGSLVKIKTRMPYNGNPITIQDESIDPYAGIDITKITLIKLDENMNPMPDHVYHYDSGQEAYLHFNNRVDIDSDDDRYDMIVAEDTPGAVFTRGSMFASIPYLHKVHVKLKYNDALYQSLSINNYSGLFANCVNLETVIFDDDTVVGMPSACFYGCTSLKTVRLATVYADHNHNSYIIGQKAFSGCTSLEEITIPRAVQDIKAYAFENTKIKRLQFTNRLWRLDDAALIDMHELEEVVFDPDLTWLDTDTNDDTVNLDLGDSVFANCEKLKSITFPFRYFFVGHYTPTNGVKARPFKDSYLENITFRNHIIGERNHESIHQNDYSLIATINQEAFNGCSHLKNLKLGFRFVRIDTDAFKGLSNFNLILDWQQGYKDTSTVSLHEELDNITSETIASWGASDVTVSYTGFIPDHGSLNDDTDGNGYNHYRNP